MRFSTVTGSTGHGRVDRHPSSGGRRSPITMSLSNSSEGRVVLAAPRAPDEPSTGSVVDARLRALGTRSGRPPHQGVAEESAPRAVRAPADCPADGEVSHGNGILFSAYP
jgi:hypothetical protein